MARLRLMGMKLPRLFSLLAFVCFLPVVASVQAQEAGPEIPVRVLSFNIRYKNTQDKGDRSWEARKDPAVQVIVDDKPDLIGFQEALRPMLDELAARVPGYQEIGVGREDGKTKGEYSCLWIRKERFTVQDSGTFWLSETPEVANSMSWGNKITRVCTWARLLDKPSNRVLHFYNVHLDHQSQEARLKGSQQVMKHIQEHAGQGPWVFTGDFNAGEDNPVITGIKANPLKPVDSWRVLHPDVTKEKSGTFHTFTGVQHEAKIDYVFVPEGTKLVDAEIIHFSQGSIFPSDHFPVRATVVFPAR